MGIADRGNVDSGSFRMALAPSYAEGLVIVIMAAGAAGVMIARVPQAASQHQELQRDDQYARSALGTTDGSGDREPLGQGCRECGQGDDDRRVGERGHGSEVDRVTPAPAPAPAPPHEVGGHDRFAVARRQAVEDPEQEHRDDQGK